MKDRAGVLAHTLNGALCVVALVLLSRNLFNASLHTELQTQGLNRLTQCSA